MGIRYWFVWHTVSFTNLNLAILRSLFTDQANILTWAIGYDGKEIIINRQLSQTALKIQSR
jgi:hypothetical protein